MDALTFAGRCLDLCVKWNGSVSSWGRTVKHNKEVGGVINSYHLVWLGCDIILDEMVVNPLFEEDARKSELDPILEKGHYHLQPMKK